AHLRQIAADRHRPESRSENIVGLAPVRLVGPRREQAIPGDRSRLREAGTKKLVEVLVVAYLIDQLEAGEHYEPWPGELQPIDRTVDFRELHQIEQRHLASEVEQVADDRVGRRLRNRLEIGLLAQKLLLALSINPAESCPRALRASRQKPRTLRFAYL